MGKLEKYLVQTVTKAEMKNGRKYLKLKLLEKGGRSWPGVFWEDRDVPTGVVVDLMVEEGEFGGTPQLDVKALRITNDDPGDYLPKSPYNVDAMFEELKGFIADVANPALKLLLERATIDPRWKRAPAAQTMHHAYLGGLLEHTVCLLRLAKSVHELYSTELNRDYLYTAAVLHDFGKIQELSSDINLSYTTEGELLGHVTLGLLRVSRIMDEDRESFGTVIEPTDLRIIVLHLIGSHHGNVNYGAIKVPMTVEAQLFSDLDGLDAHIAKARAVINRTSPDKIWTDKMKWDEPRYYLGEKK